MLLIGNWKMNLSPAAASSYAGELRSALMQTKSTDVWVTPSTLALTVVADTLRGSPIQVGAQNSHWENSGAFTGETSLSALQEIGVTFVLAGHSERRVLFNESDALIAQRVKGALAAGMTSVLCVGENEGERVAEATNRVLEKQLSSVLQEVVGVDTKKLVIAYEPVWAIGTGKVATIAEIQAAHQYIQSVVASHGITEPVKVLYGGSVNPDNFGEIGAIPEVDGALVGGASLKLEQWMKLVSIAEES